MLPLGVNPQKYANYTMPSILSTATLPKQDAHSFVARIRRDDIEMAISIKIAYSNIKRIGSNRECCRRLEAPIPSPEQDTH